MAYELDQFISDCRTSLKRDPGPTGREQVRLQARGTLHNKAFVDKYCGDNVERGLEGPRRRSGTEVPGSRAINDKAAFRRLTIMARHRRSTARQRCGPT